MDELMYGRVLVPLENSAADRTVLAHVRELARIHDSSLVFIHVADGWAARHIHTLVLRESEEMQRDRDYIEEICRSFVASGFQAEAVLAAGDPAAEIAAAAAREECDLIAMSTHGHRFFGDLIHGSVATTVRHLTTVPVLMVRAS
ncbi:MAG TPA: universal stress protein [Gemmatimonadaceae bacterium]|nr:universal stress protein [Gemmatimonadaceae bacterium]